MTLKPKQEKFCNEYLVDLNGAQAAIRAGYSKKTARSIANELLTKPDIQEYIAELKQERSQKLEITQEEVLKDIIELKNRCMQKMPVTRYDKELKQYTQEQDELGNDVWKFDSQGAGKALDMLAKHTGIYEKNNEQKSGGFNIIVADKKQKELLDNI